MIGNTLIIDTTSFVEFKNPIAERFFDNIDLAAEEYIQNEREHSLATISGILGVDTNNISTDSPEYKKIAKFIEAFAQH